MSGSSPFRDAALRYGAGGYHVFPCNPRGKTPLTRNGFKDASIDKRRILHAWDRVPDANVGIACGASNIVVLDIDAKAGADPREIIDQLDLGAHPIVLTGEAPDRDVEHPNSLSGVRGAHVPFRGATRTGGTTIPGVELRAAGAYVIAPPSVHPSAVAYEGALPAVRDLGELPGSVAIMPATPAAGAAAPAEVWLSMLRDGVPAGGRNKQLARLIGHLLRRYIDVDLAAELVHLINATKCTPPLPADEVDRIFDSIARSELRRREQR
jgi:hypothetical protein